MSGVCRGCGANPCVCESVIAQLTAELAEARRDLHEERGRANDYGEAINRARAAHERTRADFEEACKRLAFVVNERDAALAKLASVEADAAAMRLALTNLLVSGRGLRPSYASDSDRDFVVRHRKASDAAQATLDGTAGLALAARVPLWRELEAKVQALRDICPPWSPDAFHRLHDVYAVMRKLEALAALDKQ